MYGKVSLVLRLRRRGIGMGIGLANVWGGSGRWGFARGEWVSVCGLMDWRGEGGGGLVGREWAC